MIWSSLSGRDAEAKPVSLAPIHRAKTFIFKCISGPVNCCFVSKNKKMFVDLCLTYIWQYFEKFLWWGSTENESIKPIQNATIFSTHNFLVYCVCKLETNHDSPYKGMRMVVVMVNKAKVSDETEESKTIVNSKLKQPMMSQPHSEWCFNISASSR